MGFKFQSKYFQERSFPPNGCGRPHKGAPGRALGWAAAPHFPTRERGEKLWQGGSGRQTFGANLGPPWGHRWPLWGHLRGHLGGRLGAILCYLGLSWTRLPRIDGCLTRNPVFLRSQVVGQRDLFCKSGALAPDAGSPFETLKRVCLLFALEIATLLTRSFDF